MKALVIALAAGIAIGGASGGYIVYALHAPVRASLMVCEGDRELLKRSVKRQNKAVELLQAQSKEMEQAQQEALRAAERRVKEIEADIQKINVMPAVTCRDAENMIDLALGL